jgi:mannan polymerase II complex ANP1 subunit
MVSRSSINKANVPAKVIAKVAFQRDVVETCQTERYYILDSEYEAGSVIPTLRDGAQMGKVLVKMMQQIEGGWTGKGKGSTGSVSPRPTLC